MPILANSREEIPGRNLVKSVPKIQLNRKNAASPE